MWRRRMIWRVGTGLFLLALCLSSVPVTALAVSTRSLVFREVKITDSEFVVLQNVGDTPLVLNEFWLGYAGTDTSSQIIPTQQLPAATLSPGKSIVLTNDAADTCDAVVVSGLDFSSLSDTKGQLVLRQLIENTATPDISTFITVDSVNWIRPSATATTTDAIDLRKEAALAMPVWYKDPAGLTPWQVGSYDSCSLLLGGSSNGTVPQTIVWQLSEDEVPGIVISRASAAAPTDPSIPAADIGLKAPKVSELLPDVASPGTDAEDEFIELYNPNGQTFDLSGFSLQIGSTTSETRHTYTFPAGTTIAAKGFATYFAAQTNLSLNNSGGQVWLLDPLGTVIGQSDPYAKPKAGYGWASANGAWYYTTVLTPNAANKIVEPGTTIRATVATTAKTTKGTPVTAVAAKNGKVAGVSTVAGYDGAKKSAPMHMQVLVLVVGGALVYWAYEYRHDIANYYRQFRSNRKPRG